MINKALAQAHILQSWQQQQNHLKLTKTCMIVLGNWNLFISLLKIFSLSIIWNKKWIRIVVQFIRGCYQLLCRLPKNGILCWRIKWILANIIPVNLKEKSHIWLILGKSGFEFLLIFYYLFIEYLIHYLVKSYSIK